MGFSGWPRPERDSLMVLARASMASSWPKITSFRSRSRLPSCSRSEVETLRGGIFAMVATICSTSLGPMVFLRFSAGWIRTEAPTSSMTSMALSGRKRSLMCLAESLAAVRSAAWL